MSRRSSLYLTFLFLVLAQWSCKINPDASPDPVTIPISIDEARAWYEGKGSPNARLSAQVSNEMAYWKYAQNGKLANGVDIVSVPLLFNNHLPVSIVSDENFVKKGDDYSLPNFDRKAHQIQQKLLISKDKEGNYRSAVITVIPDRDEQRKKNPVKRDKFSGAVLLMNEERDSFEVGWRYKNGKVIDVFYPTPKSANGRLSAYTCKIGFYQLMAQNPNGNSGGYNCVPSHSQSCLPSSFLDAQTGGFWVLIGTFDATCDDGIPNGAPIRQNPWDDDASWVVADPSGGGGGGGPIIRDPFNPTDPTPIDYGMPMDLDPADAFAWEMANRIGPDIYLTGEEIELIRSNYWLTYKIREYVVQYDQKPDITNFINNFRFYGPDKRINNLREKLNCFGLITNDSNYEYTVTIYVDQPISDSREIYSLSNSVRKVGHTFIGLEKRNIINNQVVRLVFGYYISGIELTALTNMSVAGAWGDDGGTQYDVSVKSNLNSNQFSNLIEVLKSAGDFAPNYHLVDNNCTTFAYNLLSSYMVLPEGKSDIGFLGNGFNPANMGQDLKGYQSHYPNGGFTAGNNLTAPVSSNCN